ncbi:hypothetical protein ACFXPS_25880 [Nocardia sp. NPDC059091]
MSANVPVTGDHTVDHIRALAIPPTWKVDRLLELATGLPSLRA